MTTLTKKGLSNSELAVAVETEIRAELERIKKLMLAYPNGGSERHKHRLEGRKDALSGMLAFIIKNKRKKWTLDER